MGLSGHSPLFVRFLRAGDVDLLHLQHGFGDAPGLLGVRVAHQLAKDAGCGSNSWRGCPRGRDPVHRDPPVCQTHEMGRPSIFEFVGGAAAFQALAAALHQRCLDDPELSHPFSHGIDPHHVENLGEYWAEVFGGPPAYSQSHGGHSAMLALHAGQGAEKDLGKRFAACFVAAIDDAGFPDSPELRGAMRAYIEWAVGEELLYSPPGTDVPAGLPMPHWSWESE